MLEPLEINLGKLLHKKRQELNMEISHIASYLKVKSQDIAAIEEERWAQITKHVYKPGLIRSYAKMLKIDMATIEERIRKLPFESNTKNQKYRLLNIGEEVEITPNRDMLINFLMISVLLFLALLAIFNAFEKKSGLLLNQELIGEMTAVKEIKE